MKKIILFVTCLMLSACASLESVSLTSIPKERTKSVIAQDSKMIILGLNFDNDFVDTMTEQLRAQCPKGLVSGILTKDEMVNYFLYLVVKRKVTATGYCSASI